jgi:hypothetical protein
MGKFLAICFICRKTFYWQEGQYTGKCKSCAELEKGGLDE